MKDLESSCTIMRWKGYTAGEDSWVPEKEIDVRDRVQVRNEFKRMFANDPTQLNFRIGLTPRPLQSYRLEPHMVQYMTKPDVVYELTRRNWGEKQKWSQSENVMNLRQQPACFSSFNRTSSAIIQLYRC